MSVEFKQTDFLDKEWRYIKNALTTKSGMEFFVLKKDATWIPLAFAVKNLVNLEEPKSNPLKFTGDLRTNQIHIVEQTLQTLKTDRACIVSCPPGAGKTIMAIACIAKLGLKTTVVINRILIRNQWKAALAMYCKDAAVSFVNLQHAEKMPSSNFIVVDELHQNVSQRSFELMMSTKPDYVLGLSATPYRYDNWNECIPLLFGDTISGLFDERRHMVKIVETNILFPVKHKPYDYTVDWTDMITKQSNHAERNNLITTLILKETTVDYWLVLCKRLDQIDCLKAILAAKSSRLVVCANPKIDYNALPPCIILGTPNRLGVGFDMVKINGLCLASDVKNYFSQYMGRLRTPRCVVLDFVDENHWFRNHLKDRLEIYKHHRCEIQTYGAPRQAIPEVGTFNSTRHLKPIQ